MSDFVGIDNNRSIRVLMVLPNLRVSNGVTNFAMNYYRSVNHEETQIDFATLSYRESPYFDEVKKCGSEVFILPSIIKHPFRHIKKCKEILRNGNYCIIHVNTLNQAIPMLFAARKKVKVRILHSHSTKIGESRIKERINRLFLPILLSLSNYYAACSTNAGKALFGGTNFKIIPNLVDTNTFRCDEKKRDEIRTRENVSGKRVVGSVGRLAEPKNPYFAIDIMESMLKTKEDIEYWWIGSGPLDNAVQKYLEDKGLTNKVRLFGSREDIVDLYQAMDLFFLPSKFEGFGLACIEAQAVGLPCIVSDVFPAEVNVTGNVRFISLTQESVRWTEEINDALNRIVDKEAANRLCQESFFSQGNSGRLLTDYYYDCISSGS